MDSISIYQQTILEHSKNPKNFKILNPCSHSSNASNPLCGDKVEIYTNIKNSISNEISFQGAGCAISIASASILTEVLNKKSVNEALNIVNNFINMIENKKFNFDLMDIEKKKLLMTFSEIKKFPMRSKCATMCWSAFNTAVGGKDYISEKKI